MPRLQIKQQDLGDVVNINGDYGGVEMQNQKHHPLSRYEKQMAPGKGNEFYGMDSQGQRRGI